MDNFLALFELFGALARRRYQTADQFFTALGLNHTEARILTLLSRERGEMPQEALSDMLHVDRTNAGRALKRLERDGYVIRRKDDADKRANYVRMTAKGRRAAGEISKLRNKIARSFFGDLSNAEAGVIADLLKKAMPGVANASHK